jgi:1-acyl-sn-glycerol-3-phosphate acyltransferase
VPELNPLRYLDAALAIGGMAASDWLDLRNGLPGDDLDGWDPDYIRRTLPAMSTLLNGYFRGEVRGLENIPEDGPALLVGNHSGGTLIADTFVLATRFYERFGPDRRFHQLAHDVAARLPGLGIRQYGVVAASHDNARRAFECGAPVLVYPGGDHETYRPTWESAQIDFDGRKGFIRLALEQNVPIVPVVAIGGQETALFVTRGKRLAELTGWSRLTRIKVLPLQIAPPFGVTLLDLPIRMPLPAKITVEVQEPIDLRERFGPDPDLDDVYDEVTGEMQDTLSDLADERTLPLAG